MHMNTYTNKPTYTQVHKYTHMGKHTYTYTRWKLPVLKEKRQWEHSHSFYLLVMTKLLMWVALFSFSFCFSFLCLCLIDWYLWAQEFFHLGVSTGVLGGCVLQFVLMTVLIFQFSTFCSHPLLSTALLFFKISNLLFYLKWVQHHLPTIIFIAFLFFFIH